MIDSLVAFNFWVAFDGLDESALQANLKTLTRTRLGLSFGFFNTFALAAVIPAELVTGALYSFSIRLLFFADLLNDLIALGFFLIFLRSSRFEGAE
jgi:hypothetical protein